MTTSDKTALLEKILVTNKEKSRKRYLEWNQLLKKLNKSSRAKFNLSDISTESEVKAAIWEYQGNNLMLVYKGDVLCLAQKMSREELELEFYPGKAVLTKILHKHQTQEKKNYLAWGQLLEELKTAERKLFGLTAKTKKPTWPKLAPFLSPNMVILDEIDEGYLGINITKEELRAKLHAESHAKKSQFLHTLLDLNQVNAEAEISQKLASCSAQG